MKKILLIVLAILVLKLALPSQTFAQPDLNSPCVVGEITDFYAIPNPASAGEELSFELPNIPPRLRLAALFIIIDPSINPDGSVVSPYPRYPVYITEQGNGFALVGSGLSVGGEHSALVAMGSPTTGTAVNCTDPILLLITDTTDTESCTEQERCCVRYDTGTGAASYLCQMGAPSSQDASCTCQSNSPELGPLYCSGFKISTAIGCIPLDDRNSFMGFFMRWSIGLGGGISFLFVVLGIYRLILAGANEEEISQARNMITSAIAGLIFLLFSLSILQLIGQKVLGIL